ncbi:MAG: aminotransferase class III-fold pyridoxal phosphate-dependent enzyme [Planctomycetes bacterium]|nr:aminotransferase class III-fold pyridoxal phosphate-dependent enzyme [Planctomycetota bacterium]
MNSEAWWARGRDIIPAGTQTLSKGPNQFVDGVYPKYLTRGQGAYVCDVDGNWYIDYPMALGPIILGHAYPRVIEAAARQMTTGTTFTLMHPLEVEVAELLVDMIPCSEMVRFGKNGSDVTTAAVRIARSYTGRDHIAYCGYHGWQDWYACVTQRDAGLPRELKQWMHPFAWNQTETLEAIFAEYSGGVAAVILEVPGQDPAPGFLEQVQVIARRHGAVLIFDEIVTGFRFALGGAQQRFGVTPDLACFGKAMANGFPLSALVGRRELMRELERVFFSMTFGGEVVSLAAAKATLEELRERPVVEHLWSMGMMWRQGFAELADHIGAPVRLDGHPPRSGFVFSPVGRYEPLMLKGLFIQETVKRGVLFGGPIFMTYSHGPDEIQQTLAACGEALDVLVGAIRDDNVFDCLEGTPPTTVFRPQ